MGTMGWPVVLRLRLVGRDWFLAFWYNPQALQIVSPAGDRRHKGVLVVPQLLWRWSAKIRKVPVQGLHGSEKGRDVPADLARNKRVSRDQRMERKGRWGGW
jgi:hypothetical protein